MFIVNYFKNMFLTLIQGALILIVAGLLGVAISVVLIVAILISAITGKELDVSLSTLSEKAKQLGK